MTTYSYNTLDKREIGSGCESNAYHAWRKPKEATIFTTNRHKWDYINFMGLATSPQVRVYVEYESTRWNGRRVHPYWRFNALKMRAVGSSDPAMLQVYDEMRRFNYVIANNDIDEFDVLRPAIAYCRAFGIEEAVTDGNYF